MRQAAANTLCTTKGEQHRHGILQKQQDSFSVGQESHARQPLGVTHIPHYERVRGCLNAANFEAFKT